MRLGTRKLTISGIFATMGTLALLLAGCGGSSGPTGPTDKAADQTLHMGWQTGGGPDIPTLDPSEAQDSASIPIVGMISTASSPSTRISSRRRGEPLAGT